jgi:hypothetical protein
VNFVPNFVSKFVGYIVKVLLMAGLAVFSVSTREQQLEPRAYANTPVGMNFLLTGYGHTEGSVGTDAGSPLEDAQVTTDTLLLGYARSFGILGKSAKAGVSAGETWISGSASFQGQTYSRSVSGLTDVAIQGSINLYGAPALTLSEFTNYQQKLIVGTSLTITAPIGDYDDKKLLNIGNNRWSFRPELGFSQCFGRLTLEVVPAVTLYTDNEDFLGRTKSQDPLYSVQGHVIYSFRRGFWGSVSGTYYTGGSTELNGIGQNNLQENYRVGAMLSVPLGENESIKVDGSTGVWARTGSDFWLIGAAFQIRWGGGR